MVLKINGNVVEQKVGEWIQDGATYLLGLIDQSLPYVVTLGIMTCASGMMIGPMLGQSPGLWFGRLILVFWIGVGWLVIL